MWFWLSIIALLCWSGSDLFSKIGCRGQDQYAHLKMVIAVGLVMEKMRASWRAMLEADDTYQGDRRSASGLVGGDGEKMRCYAAEGAALSGEYLTEVIAAALCTGESNACMRKIVAAPTAGACGVLPAVLIPLYHRGDFDEDAIVRGLYVAAGIGAVVGYRACIAGASGGCQAEIGTASAMAAGTLTALRGGTCAQIGHAAAMALKNLLGLVCDPVAGLVEVPCVKRNVIGAVNAVSCADMAIAGIESRIPVDQVIDCMYRIEDIQRMAADGITRIIDQRLTAINRAVGILAGGAS